MRFMARALATCATICAFTAVDASACSCVPRDDREAYRMADAAFVGKLVSVTRDRRAEGEPQRSDDTARFRYEIVKRYKRALGRRFVTVHASTQGASCGLPTRTGRRYAMYLDRRNGRWTSGLCLLTTRDGLAKAARGERGARQARVSLGCRGGSFLL